MYCSYQNIFGDGIILIVCTCIFVSIINITPDTSLYQIIWTFINKNIINYVFENKIDH